MRAARLGLAVAIAALLALPAASAFGQGSQRDLDDPDPRVVIAGGTDVGPSDTVGDVFVVEGDVSVDGFVDGDLVAVEGDVRISGDVSGDVTTFAGQATIDRSASIGGDVTYGDEKPEIADGADIGGEVTDEDLDDFSDAPWALIAGVAIWIALSVSLLVLGLMLVAMMPRVAEATARTSRESLWESVGIGIAAWIALAVIGFFALFTLIGIPFGLILLSAVIPAAALGYLAASFALGRRVASSASPILAFLAGFGILRAVALVPVLGGLVSALAATFGIGFLVVAASRAGAGSRAASPTKPAAKKKVAAKRKPAAKKKAAAKKKPAAR